MKSTRKSTGFMLIETLITLVLLSIFAAVATPLLRNTFRFTTEAEAAHDRILRTESIWRALREDVWNASRIETTPDGIRLEQSHQSVTWKFDDETIERNASPKEGVPSALRWRVDELPSRIEPSPGGVDLILADPSNNPVERIHFTSQLMTLEKGSP